MDIWGYSVEVTREGKGNKKFHCKILRYYYSFRIFLIVITWEYTKFMKNCVYSNKSMWFKNNKKISISKKQPCKRRVGICYTALCLAVLIRSCVHYAFSESRAAIRMGAMGASVPAKGLRTSFRVWKYEKWYSFYSIWARKSWKIHWIVKVQSIKVYCELAQFCHFTHSLAPVLWEP